MKRLPKQQLAPCDYDTYSNNIHRINTEKMEPETKITRRSRRNARETEFEENSQRVVIPDEDQSESDDNRRRKTVPKETELETDVDSDPFMSAIKLQNSKMKRSQKRYEYIDDVIRSPGVNWTGRDLPNDVDLMSPQFWSPQYTYEIQNLRIRRSKYNRYHYVNILKSQDQREPQRLSFSLNNIPQIIEILKNLQREVKAYEQ